MSESLRNTYFAIANLVLRSHVLLSYELLPVISLVLALPLNEAVPLTLMPFDALLFERKESEELSPLSEILLREWFLVLWIVGASGGPNRRLYESLPGLLPRGDSGLIVPVLVPFFGALSKKLDPNCDWLWFFTRRGLVSSGAPKISLLPPPGGFKTLKSQLK